MTLGQPTNPALPTPAPQTPTQRELGPKSALKWRLHVRSSGSAPVGSVLQIDWGGNLPSFLCSFLVLKREEKELKKNNKMFRLFIFFNSLLFFFFLIQTLSKLISKSWEHLIVLINLPPREIQFV